MRRYGNRTMFGDDGNVLEAIKAQAIANVKQAVDNYKIAYLKKAKSKSKIDLLAFKSENWKGLQKNLYNLIVSKYLPTSVNPNYIYWLINSPVNYYPETKVWMAVGGRNQEQEASYIGLSSFIDFLNSSIEKTASNINRAWASASGGGGGGYDDNFLKAFTVEEYPKMLELIVMARDIIKEWFIAQQEFQSNSDSASSAKVALEEALIKAQQYIQNLPTLQQIMDRLLAGTDPLVELAPPPPVVPDVVATNQVIEPPKPKSKAPLFIAAGLAALAFVGSRK